MHLVSIQVGSPKPSAAGSLDETSIDKRPVDSARIEPAGLVGDSISDLKNHGGPDQAVYMYTRPDYAHWEAELGRPLRDGLFGENLTLSDLESGDVMIGDRFLIGDVELEAASSRIPCGVFQEHLAETDWTRRFRDARRPGIYCRVVTPGTVRTGDAIEHVPASGTISLLETQDLYYDIRASAERLRHALASPIAERARTIYEERLARRD